MSDDGLEVAGAAGERHDTFPRQYARTRRLTLGEPRTVTVSPDGRRVVFVRSRHGSDPVNCLWVLDVTTGEETLVADPLVLLQEGDESELLAAERARRTTPMRTVRRSEIARARAHTSRVPRARGR